MKEGWVIPLGARKAHYIVRASSLCMGWTYDGDRLNPNFADGSEECSKCRMLLDQLRALGKRENNDGK